MKRASLLRGLWLLPLRARLFAALVVAIAALPGVFSVLSALRPDSSAFVRLVGENPLLGTVLALVLAALALLAFERPEQWSLPLYSAQVRRAFTAVVQQHQAALARLHKEKTE